MYNICFTAKVRKGLRIRCISVCIKFVLFLYFFVFLIKKSLTICQNKKSNKKYCAIKNNSYLCNVKKKEV
nr:MAG TPA: hypothetical protein [Caudoviricetes sp.]